MSGNVPIRRKDFDVQGFVSWLAESGCEIGMPTNAYEVVRYLSHREGHKKPVTHIIYAKENGLLTYMPGTREHYAAFLGIDGDGTPTKRARPASAAMRRFRKQVIERDGNECWFCGTATTEGDSSVEHLVARAHGGPDTLANFVIAHPACNHKAGSISLGEKISLRAAMRKERA